MLSLIKLSSWLWYQINTFCCPATKHRASELQAYKILHLSAVWNELADQLFIGGPLLNIRAWVGVVMAGVLGALREPEMGVDLEGVAPWEGVRGRVVWCGALLMEALCGGQSLRPEVALGRLEEQEVKESDVHEEEPGCLGWSPHLWPVGNEYSGPARQTPLIHNYASLFQCRIQIEMQCIFMQNQWASKIHQPLSLLTEGCVFEALEGTQSCFCLLSTPVLQLLWCSKKTGTDTHFRCLQLPRFPHLFCRSFCSDSASLGAEQKVVYVSHVLDLLECKGGGGVSISPQ